MIGSYPRRTRAKGFPISPTEAENEEFINGIGDHWGTTYSLDIRAPWMRNNERFGAWRAKFQRMSTSPVAAGGVAAIRHSARPHRPQQAKSSLSGHAALPYGARAN
jgi:hypothetical protein